MQSRFRSYVRVVNRVAPALLFKGSNLHTSLRLHHHQHSLLSASLNNRFHRRLQHTMSSPQPRTEPFPVGSTLQGDSGQVYVVQEILSERLKPLLCVYRARSEGKDFVVKDMVRGEFDYIKSLQMPLASHPHLRVFVDAISANDMFVYNFLAEDLFRFSRRPLSNDARRGILKSALTGLVELHDRRIFHTDIKPDNILIEYDGTPGKDLAITQVRISDLEDSVLLDPGECLEGCLCGNELWRSPESWARAGQSLPADVFSFAIMATYVMLNRMVFLASNEELKGDMAWQHVLRKHILYFGDMEGVEGLVEHIGRDNPFFERLVALVAEFGDHNPRQPFAGWQGVDEEFRDMITKMTSLDPKRRMTAREALQHPWFQNASSK